MAQLGSGMESVSEKRSSNTCYRKGTFRTSTQLAARIRAISHFKPTAVGVTLEGIGGEGYADYRRQVSRTPAC